MLDAILKNLEVLDIYFSVLQPPQKCIPFTQSGSQELFLLVFGPSLGLVTQKSMAHSVVVVMVVLVTLPRPQHHTEGSLPVYGGLVSK